MSIIDLIKGQLGPELISQAATQLGESESGVSKAAGALLPAVLGGLANNADKPGVMDAITGAASSGLLGNLLGGSSDNSMISNVLSAIFGDKIGGIANAIASYAGISNSSSSSLMNMVTGAALGSIGKHAADNNLDASGISSLLGGLKGSALSALLPAGLSLGSLGLGNLFGDAKEDVSAAASRVSEAAADVKREVSGSVPSYSTSDDNGGGGSFWKWLLPLLLLALAGWFLMKQCKKDGTETTTTTDTTAVATDTAAAAVPGDSAAVAAPAAKVDGDIDLNGTMLKGYPGGFEDKMIGFLKSDGYKNAADDAALKSTWYDFDHVNFKIGKSDQLESGAEQIANLVAILKAYPDAKIKIGGYTDKSGNEDANVKLSQARADFIKAELAKAGVGAQVLGAEGYGSKFATLPATASVEERAVDRKMAVRFSK